MIKIPFFELQFPTDIAYGVSGGPEFNTDIIVTSSGYEQRNINWSCSRNKYNLAPSIKNQEQLDQLLKFFYLCQGRAIGFRFKDWLDYKLTNQQIEVGDGKKTQFQLIKTYGDSNFVHKRKISKPIVNSIKVFVDDVEVFPEIIGFTGVINFVHPPQSEKIITVTGEFDVAVRFDVDHLPLSFESYEIYSHQEISLVEIKL